MADDSSSGSSTPSYKDTLNLPKTSFDMKANLTQREPAMLKAWQEQNLYGQIRKERQGGAKGKWVLHDGPPYANGDIHMGHLINKVLKDMVVKFRTMQGFDSPYVPGWDCHGLPIESAIQKELGPKFRELSKEEVRRKCHEYAMKFVKLQGEGFQRLGVFGDFKRPYLTLDPKYEAGILDVLAELVQRELVYRKKKPVHWCVNDRTALAEAELEYAERTDNSVYVLFRMKQIGGNWIQHDPNDSSKNSPITIDGDVDLMIWTTTPWTLPANRAVAINPVFNYALIEYTTSDGKTHRVILAKGKEILAMHLAGISTYRQLGIVQGGGLGWLDSKPTYIHPIDPQREPQPIVSATYVTAEDGTGLVHTAPGHGTEDYQTGLRNHLEIYNPVLPDGRYDETVPEFLRGKLIWDANELVIEKLQELGTLFHHQEFDHSYPHCWRCKKPVIFRATEQWFVKASSEPRPSGSGSASPVDEPLPYGRGSDGSLWQNAKRFVNKVQFVPHWGKNRLEGMLDTRPDWCISRQRSWGVPIPAFFDAKGKVLMTEASVRRVAAYFKAHGADSWYTDSAEAILGLTEGAVGSGLPTPEAAGSGEKLAALGFVDPAAADGKEISNLKFDISELTKGMDILDVWFESGASHHAVLECTHPELGYPVEMYLEGSDQHRGWFQSSLLEAAGYKKEPPFKEVLTHGFIVDGQGRKMSKSEGNDIKVADALKEYGADVLRLWVSSVDYQNDIPLSKELLKTIGESYRKIRNTIRYLLGNLYDFNPAEDTTPPEATSINAWMSERADAVFRESYHALDTYEFHRFFRTLYEFCNVDVSSIYAKAIKDRLYCELPDSPRRRAAQSVCYQILVSLVQLLAPVLVYTAEESWAAIRALPGGAALKPSVHLCIIAERPTVRATSFAAHWQVLMPLIEKGNKQLDDLKKSIGLGNALDAEAVIIVPAVADELSPLITHYGPEIEDALGVGFHRIEHGEVWDIKINDTRAIYPSCARSWKRRPDVGSNPAYPDLSARDAAVVEAIRGR